MPVPRQIARSSQGHFEHSRMARYMAPSATHIRLDTKHHMRSSKSRSRSNTKSRNVRPSGGNIINRVFDSSGPDGKVRGTPQQIIEKYTQLHRDAQLSNDRVNAENFAQHAEHYTRILAEAMREVDKAREEQEQFNRDRQVERDQQMARQNERQPDRQNDRQPDRQNDRQPDRQNDRQSDRQPDRQNDRPSERQLSDRERQSERDRERVARLRAQEEASADPALMDQPYVRDTGFVPDSGLVETPEEVRRPTAEMPRGERPVRVDRGPRPERNPERNLERAAERQAEVKSEPQPEPVGAEPISAEPAPRAPRPERSTRQSPVAALLAEVEQPKAETEAAPRAVRARKPKPKPEVVTEGPAEAAE